MKDFVLLQGLAEGAKLMSKREYRRFTAEQQIEVLREADQSGVAAREVCRRHVCRLRSARSRCPARRECRRAAHVYRNDLMVEAVEVPLMLAHALRLEAAFASRGASISNGRHR